MICLRALFFAFAGWAIIAPAASAKGVPYRDSYSDCVVARDAAAARLALAKLFERNESNAMETLYDRFVGCGDAGFPGPLLFAGQVSESLMMRGYASEKHVDLTAGGWNKRTLILYGTCIANKNRTSVIDVLQTRRGSLAEAAAMKSLIVSSPNCLNDDDGKPIRSTVAARYGRGITRAALALAIYATGGAGTDFAKEASNA